MILDIAAAASGAIRFDDLGVGPVALDLGFFTLKWYSLAYLAGILIGYWYLLKLIAQPGSPMGRRHADDMIFYATLGIIIGGRLAYVIFYQPEILAHPLDIFKLWNGGMSFHGGAAGVSLGILYMARKEKLSWLRIHDYVACCVPFGLFFGRLANFVNGELWGKETDVPWGIIFPTGGPYPRHPSQLYEAALEGLVLFAILAFAFWRTRALSAGEAGGHFPAGLWHFPVRRRICAGSGRAVDGICRAYRAAYGPVAVPAHDLGRPLPDRHVEGASRAGGSHRRKRECQLSR